MTTEASVIPRDPRCQMERVYRAWDVAIAAGDVSSLVNLYALDAAIESPRIYELTKSKTGTTFLRKAVASFGNILGPLRQESEANSSSLETSTNDMKSSPTACIGAGRE